jgi:hypothetical protein
MEPGFKQGPIAQLALTRVYFAYAESVSATSEDVLICEKGPTNQIDELLQWLPCRCPSI